MGFITKAGLEELKRYKYVSGGYSFMDKIMNHWWEFFVKLIPLVSRTYLSHFAKPITLKGTHYLAPIE